MNDGYVMVGSPVMPILLYVLIDLFPNLALAYLPFRHHLRLPLSKAVGASAVLYVAIAGCRILNWYHPEWSMALTVGWIFLYILFYRLCIRGHLSKMVFVLLCILNYNSFIMIVGSYLNYYRLGNEAMGPYSLPHTLMNLVVLVLTYPAVAYVFRQKIGPLVDFPEPQKTWNYLWLIPATFCLSYYYNIFSGGGLSIYITRFENIIFAALYNAGAFFVTVVIVHLLAVSNNYLLLKTEH
ncbi:MAG: hypothetical protein LBV33_06190, partial [Lachnospiraceae bacterium]|nr:hypothetical protein [Lachnospiraceae bacterium]